MSKSIKLKDNTFIDSTGVTHDRDLLSTILNNIYSFDCKYDAGQTVNANDFVKSGFYLFDTNETITNRPTKVVNQVDFLLVINHKSSWTNSTIQIWFNYNAALYFRVRVWGSWASWKKITIS